ncbi:MAG: PG0541 family transporter-associated protein [bacterium]
MSKMKAVFIIFNPAIEYEVMEILEKLKVEQYTSFPYLHGIGGHSEPKLDTHVWPGSNMGIFIATDEDSTLAILKEISALK